MLTPSPLSCGGAGLAPLAPIAADGRSRPLTHCHYRADGREAAARASSARGGPERYLWSMLHLEARTILPVAAAAIAIVIFVVDTATPFEGAIAVIYVVVVLISALFLP